MTTRREARAQAASDAAPGAFPPEFLLGRCVDVWGLSNGDGWTRYLRGMDARADALGLDSYRRHRPPEPYFRSQPWSVAYLDATGRSDTADRALAHAGVRRSDLPALRQAAQAGWRRMCHRASYARRADAEEPRHRRSGVSARQDGGAFLSAVRRGDCECDPRQKDRLEGLALAGVEC